MAIDLDVGELYWVNVNGETLELRLSSIIIRRNTRGEPYVLGRFDSRSIVRALSGIYKTKQEAIQKRRLK